MTLILNTIQKQAVSRILIAIANADKVVTHEEIDYLNQIRLGFDISDEDILLGKKLDVDKCILIIKEMDKIQKEALSIMMQEIMRVDGEIDNREFEIFLVICIGADIPLPKLNSKKSEPIKDWKKMNLQGKVMSIKERSYFVRNGDETNNTFTIFNHNGNIVECSFYYVNGSLFKKLINKYSDKEGNYIVEQIRYSAFNNVESKTLIKNDNMGNMIERNVFNASGIHLRRVVSKHDGNGNETEQIWYNSAGNLEEKYTYKYNEYGSKIEENSADRGHITFSYLYDNLGNVIEENHFMQDRSLNKSVTYKYLYDNIKNWVKKTSFIDNKPIQVTERKLIYF
jgi:hypothetical protein